MRARQDLRPGYWGKSYGTDKSNPGVPSSLASELRVISGLPPHQASTENFRISATGQKQSFQLSTGAPEVVLKRAGAPGDRASHHFPSWEFIFF